MPAGHSSEHLTNHFTHGKWHVVPSGIFSCAPFIAGSRTDQAALPLLGSLRLIECRIAHCEHLDPMLLTSHRKVYLMKKQSALNILFIHNSIEICREIRGMFKDQGSYAFKVTHVRSIKAAEARLALHPVEVVLLDLRLGDTECLEAIRRVRVPAPDASIVFLSEGGIGHLVKQALKEGVQDYLIKGKSEPGELPRTLQERVAWKLIESSRDLPEDYLFTEEESAQLTLDSIGDGVISTEMEGNITFLNPVAQKLVGWTNLEAIGRPIGEVFHIVDAVTREVILNPMKQAVQQNRIGHLPINCILIRRDGQESYIEDSASPIHNREGKIIGSVIVFRDVTSARLLAEKAIHTSQHDDLTGLPNRVLLNDRLEQAIALAKRHKGKVAILFLDLDGFKHINDSLGHLTGDKLLQSVAHNLQQCVRMPDTVSRQGGDEFILLLQDVKRTADIAETAKRVLQAIAEPYTIDQRELHVTASLGVSLYPDSGLDAETLIKNADTAMYQAKARGRHGYMFFKPSMNAQAVERQSIEEDLRCALQRHEFTLQYQPKVSLKTGKIVGAEALLRWTHSKRGSIPPSRFIAIAEDTGLILDIGAWVLRKACTQAQAWMKAGLPRITISVNVSAVQLAHETFLADLFSTLDETGLDPKSLELEVTETVLMKHAELAASILQTLRDKGVLVSVDDFGTGYSSLSYLKEFPLDSLKIDQSFVLQADSAPNDSTLVSAIVSMGHSLNLCVIAEGVETFEAVEVLRALDCDEAQGRYFSGPISAKHFARLLGTVESFPLPGISEGKAA